MLINVFHFTDQGLLRNGRIERNRWGDALMSEFVAGSKRDVNFS